MNLIAIGAGVMVLLLAAFAIYSATRSEQWAPDKPTDANEEIAVKMPRTSEPTAKPITPWTIFWAVFAAMWAFSITAGFVVFFFRTLNWG